MSDLTFDQYADALAHMDYFGHSKGPEIRERLEIDEDVWSAGEPKCVAAIRDDTLSGEHDLVISFGRRLAATKERLEQEQPALDSIGTIRPTQEVSEQPVALEHTPADEVPAPPAPGVPQAPMDASPAPLPIVHAPAPPPTPMHAPAEPPPLKQPLPPPPPPVVVAQPTPRATQVGVDETAMVEGLVPSEVLPFDDEPVEQVQARLAPSPSSGSVVAIGLTAEVPAIRLDVNVTLPFVDVSPVDFGDDSDKRDGEPRARLTLEQFASLTAELALRPEQRRHVLTRYGVDELSLRGLHGAWAARFRSSPDDKSRFEQLVAQYRAWLASHR